MYILIAVISDLRWPYTGQHFVVQRVAPRNVA